MGVVYLAEHTTIGKRVAMKFLSATTKEYRARFLREARTISALDHPNIATIFEARPRLPFRDVTMTLEARAKPLV